jgi:hypothetical protein
MRAVDGSGELPVAAYELFSDTEVLGRMALDRMLAGQAEEGRGSCGELTGGTRGGGSGC